MSTSFPVYSHPYRAKVVMLKGQKGDSPTVEIEETADDVTITATNPNDGHPETTTAEIIKPKAKVTQTADGATVTITDGDGTTSANLSNGLSVRSAAINANNHLIITMTDGSTVDAGIVNFNELTTAYNAQTEELTLDIGVIE